MITRMDTRPPAATDPAPRRRRLRNALIAAAVLLVLVAGTVLYLRSSEPAPPIATPVPRVTAPAPTAPVTTAPSAPLPAAAADGCLGGTDPHTAVLAAQGAAALDSIGAAEFALAAARLVMTYPFGADADAVGRQVMTDPSQWEADVARIDSEQEGTGNAYRLIAPETWKYRVVNNTGEQAVVQVHVTREFVPVGTQPLGHAVVGEFHLVARDGHWWMAELVTPSSVSDPTYTTGFQPYFGGCGS